MRAKKHRKNSTQLPVQATEMINDKLFYGAKENHETQAGWVQSIKCI